MTPDDFFATLRAYSASNVFNPWKDTDPLDRERAFAAVARRDRLRAHFKCKARFVLIGEAPGYQGCRFSGVPFTNEALICTGAIPRVSELGLSQRCLSHPRFTTRDKPWSEPSATIVWRTLHSLGIAESTVMWNTFPFHPHKPGEPYSNRPPTKQEVLDGKPYLLAMLNLFKDAAVVAVGQVAYSALSDLGVSVTARVRHPSMGGAHEFEDGMGELVR